VRRHNRLPQCLVVDGGPEFHSTYFEALLARYECTKKTRPPAQARFGSLVERVFGTTNTQFLYNLLGNTQMTRNVRQVTKSVNPHLSFGRTLSALPFTVYLAQGNVSARLLRDLFAMARRLRLAVAQWFSRLGYKSS